MKIDYKPADNSIGADIVAGGVAHLLGGKPVGEVTFDGEGGNFYAVLRGGSNYPKSGNVIATIRKQDATNYYTIRILQPMDSKLTSADIDRAIIEILMPEARKWFEEAIKSRNTS